ncbi:MAG: XVIPCD domain-containing protein [Luteibacter sp.]|uniref:XVIPCD domain-containing protein n=1 Tax=Luteibacter sp. TaxID=1886636 RepID=UPI002808AB1F|nr:XVIPCD domain-containing protein [Luteibacter sp.]MDQ7996190.1 peptidoglycan-binding protein [Luteibacter sp.]MDQ8048885.1 peptidoglycan-binding protein [Luteibacter sp.]
MADENPLDTRWNAARQDLVDAANTAGIDPGVLVKIAGFESGFNSHARPIAGHKHSDLNTITQFDGTKAMSTAYGYGQFLNATWAGMVREHGDKYGIANASELTDKQINTAEIRNNTKLQAGMLAEFTKANAEKGAALGGSDAAANVYAMHNLGGSDGPKFLRAMSARPDARVDSVLSSTVIERNTSLYGDGSITLSEAYKNMGAQMERYAPYAAQVSGLSQGQPAQANVATPATHTRHEASVPTPAVSAHRRTLHEGMHGEDVRALQKQLGELGYKDAHGQPLKADAAFGPSTKTALEALQAKEHLSVDGVAGPSTLSHLRTLAEQTASVKAPVTDAAKPLLDHPDHPGHGMFRQALDGMEKIDAAQGREPDQITSRVAGSVAAEAQTRGLSRIDGVALSTDATQCWAVQGHQNDPFKQYASVDLNQAVNTSLAQSTASWEQARQQQQTAQAQVQDQQHGQQQAQPQSMQR